jgi:hypothetical protein
VFQSTRRLSSWLTDHGIAVVDEQSRAGVHGGEGTVAPALK